MSTRRSFLAAFQAQRASSMAKTVGQDYDQPANQALMKKLREAYLPDGSQLSEDEVESLSRQVVLPGAKRAVHLDRVQEMHARGLSQHQMVAEINGAIDQALGNQYAKFRDWRDGPMAEHVRRVQEREARRQQLLAHRRAEIERQLDSELGADGSETVTERGDVTIHRRAV